METAIGGVFCWLVGLFYALQVRKEEPLEFLSGGEKHFSLSMLKVAEQIVMSSHWPVPWRGLPSSCPTIQHLGFRLAVSSGHIIIREEVCKKQHC